jgi:hypothetical protein
MGSLTGVLAGGTLIRRPASRGPQLILFPILVLPPPELLLPAIGEPESKGRDPLFGRRLPLETGWAEADRDDQLQAPEPLERANRSLRGDAELAPNVGEGDRPPLLSSTREERAQLLEQATRGHHALIMTLALHLDGAGWREIEEVPGGFDLWATKADRRVIFEAKTLRNSNAAHQVRLAIAQLLEYRFIYGTPTDSLCLVTDAPVTQQRVRLMDSLNIGFLIRNAEGIRAAGGIAPSLGL